MKILDIAKFNEKTYQIFKLIYKTMSLEYANENILKSILRGGMKSV